MATPRRQEVPIGSGAQDSPVTLASPDVRLNPQIRTRGREMYLNDKVSGQSKVRPDESTTGDHSLLSTLGTMTLGAATGQFHLANPLRILQSAPFRSGKLESLASNRGITDTYDVDTNSYKNLGILDQILYDINPDDVSSKVIRNRQKAVEGTDEYQQLVDFYGSEDALKKELGGSTSLVGAPTLRKAGKYVADHDTLTTGIKEKDNGAQMLSDAITEKGEKLTTDELRTLFTKVKAQTPEGKKKAFEFQVAKNIEKRAKETQVDTLATNKATRELADKTHGLNVQKEENRKTEFGAEIDYKNNVAGYNYKLANEQGRRKYESEGKDRDLRRDLAVLGLDDKASERRYQSERDERKDRQLMIMQLMKGMGNLGAAFAL